MQLKIYLPVLGLAACACLAAAETNPIQILTKAPLRFEPSDPASGNATKFIARGTRFHFEFSADQAILRSGKKDVRLSFEGANRAARVQGAQLLGSTTNLYLGNDPSRWRHAVPNYGRVEVEQLYSGIDLAYYGNGGELEYDLTVNPGANPQRIRFRLDGSGLIQKHPVAYQTGAGGSRHLVASSYQKNVDGSYGFRLGVYDRSRTLVIDPTVTGAQ